jgi:SAM-dependent methyltransferase
VAKNSSRYNHAEVADYWSQRLRETDPLAAVLTYGAPAAINEAYHRWEIGSLDGVLKRTQRRKLPLRGMAALDVACGIGRITRRLAELGARTSAIDLAPAMITAAKRRCAGLGVDFARAAADDMPFGDSSFDIITCFGLLEHLPSRPRAKCLSEIVRLLKPRGRAYLVVNNTDCIFLAGRGKGATRRGYHVELVGLDWLEQAAEANQAEIRIRAANPGYGIAHYQMLEGKRDSRLKRRHAELIPRLMKLNDLISPDSSPARSLASHFLVELSILS